MASCANSSGCQRYAVENGQKSRYLFAYREFRVSPLSQWAGLESMLAQRDRAIKIRISGYHRSFPMPGLKGPGIGKVRVIRPV